eukprot:GHVL01020459.1.p1 GENE.GHVL01020459.1~~GHVL01020459.1.p1  ORF type:complete len:341 (+),score=40.93 GHVL01020459.1:96-1118(+)
MKLFISFLICIFFYIVKDISCASSYLGPAEAVKSKPKTSDDKKIEMMKEIAKLPLQRKCDDNQLIDFINKTRKKFIEVVESMQTASSREDKKEFEDLRTQAREHLRTFKLSFEVEKLTQETERCRLYACDALCVIELLETALEGNEVATDVKYKQVARILNPKDRPTEEVAEKAVSDQIEEWPRFGQFVSSRNSAHIKSQWRYFVSKNKNLTLQKQIAKIIKIARGGEDGLNDIFTKIGELIIGDTTAQEIRMPNEPRWIRENQPELVNPLNSRPMILTDYMPLLGKQSRSYFMFDKIRLVLMRKIAKMRSHRDMLQDEETDEQKIIRACLSMGGFRKNV